MLMNVEAYLKRIGYSGPRMPSVNILRRLHRRHLLSIPFENLNIFLHRPIILSEAAFHDKIIKHHRGGFCYELNGSFAFLLRNLGFKVSMLSARVARRGGSFSPDYDHLTLLVQLNRPWLADVGFGDSIQIQPNAAKAGGFHSQMQLAANVPKVSLQKRSIMHAANC